MDIFFQIFGFFAFIAALVAGGTAVIIQAITVVETKNTLASEVARLDTDDNENFDALDARITALEEAANAE